VKIYDLYGPTEATTYSTVCLRDRGGETTIGRPIANTQAYIFDESGTPLPTRMVGELYVGGAGLARGYLNQPALSAEKFVFNRHANGRLYRTGDLARFTADGRLQYLGRKDGQVKVRGYRIEPGEIEACLLEHPMVRDCVVVGCETPSQAGGMSLVAYVTEARPAGYENGAPRDLFMAALAEFVAERLPNYMAPSQFVLLPALPLMPNGKVDRRALPSPADAARREPADAKPRNDIEQRLCALWRAVLKREHIGIRDSFFEQGGDSLLLLKLASAIERAFDLHVDHASLFASLTIEAQARLLGRELELGQLLRAVSVGGEARPNKYVDL
jgi:acyl-coenzyme A synthetase/AMP-(fatty) acid ligase